MLDGAVEQIGDGGKVDVRMRPHVHAVPGGQPRRPELIDEDERADHRPGLGRKGAADLEVAKVMRDGGDLDHGPCLAENARRRVAKLMEKPDIAGVTCGP